MLLAASTSISLVDALAVYGKFGCTTIISELEASAGLLLAQLIVLAVVLAMAGLAKVIDRLPAQQKLAKTLLILFAGTILVKLLWLDYITKNLFQFQVANSKSIVVLVAIALITMLVVLARQYLKRVDAKTSQSILTNEHLLLATPIAMALVFVAFSETSDRLAFVQWHQPVFMAIGAALLIIALIPVEKRRYLLGKSAILTVACFGIVFAPLISQRIHISSSLSTKSPAGAPQHVLLLMVDTLRYDALSIYEPSNNLTPTFEELAKKSVVFDNAYSTSCWTLPAMSSILTGVSPMAHQVTLKNSLSDKFTTIGEAFAAHGYRTSAIVNNPILYPDVNIPKKNFQEYQAFPSKQDQRPSFGLSLLWHLFPKQWPAKATTTDLTNLATRWYEQNQEDNTFLWLHYFDPHDPYEPPDIYLNPDDDTLSTELGKPSQKAPLKKKLDPTAMEMKDLYMAEARYVDDEIGRLLDFLKDKDLFDDMLIIFASDHGEAFGEHGNVGHGMSLHEVATRVPFLIKMPGQSHHVKVSENVSIVEIYPTLVELCNLSTNDEHFEGRSLKDFCESADTKPEPIPIISAFTIKAARSRSIVYDGYKLIYYGPILKDRLFSLDSDPQELRDIAQEQPETAARLMAMLIEANKAANTSRELVGLIPLDKLSQSRRPSRLQNTDVKKEELSPDQLEALEAVGYLDALE